jgi:hypothetical protein
LEPAQDLFADVGLGANPVMHELALDLLGVHDRLSKDRSSSSSLRRSRRSARGFLAPLMA